MIFCKKKQSRIWCVNTIYRDLKLKLPLSQVDEYEDEVIFAHSKGDRDYFVQMRHLIVKNYDAIVKVLDAISVYDDLMTAIMICFIVEIKYLKIDCALMIKIYSDLLAYYGETDKFKRFHLAVQFIEKSQ